MNRKPNTELCIFYIPSAMQIVTIQLLATLRRKQNEIIKSYFKDQEIIRNVSHSAMVLKQSTEKSHAKSFKMYSKNHTTLLER